VLRPVGGRPLAHCGRLLLRTPGWPPRPVVGIQDLKTGDTGQVIGEREALIEIIVDGFDEKHCGVGHNCRSEPNLIAGTCW